MKFFIGCVRIIPLVILVWLVACLIVYTVLAQEPDGIKMYNCGNPGGLQVDPSGRVIKQDEVFIMIGQEYLNEDGMSVLTVYDGVIVEDSDGLFVCEVQ